MTWLTHVSDLLLTFNLAIALTVLKLYIALKVLNLDISLTVLKFALTTYTFTLKQKATSNSCLGIVYPLLQFLFCCVEFDWNRTKTDQNI